MQQLYYLNSDCIQNFEIARFKILFRILSITKDFYQRIYDISIVKICDIVNYKQHVMITNLHLFRNLTYLELNFEKICEISVNFYLYRQSYINLHKIEPCLKKLKSNNIYGKNMIDMKSLKQIENMNLPSIQGSTNLLNAYIYLSRLKMVTSERNIFNNMVNLDKLKILHVDNKRHTMKDINNVTFLNLEKLSIHIQYYLEQDNIRINAPMLTYLKLHNKNERNTMLIYLDITTRIQYLNLHNIYLDENYFANNTSIKILELHNNNYGNNREIILHRKYMINLKSFELTNFKKISWK